MLWWCQVKLISSLAHFSLDGPQHFYMFTLKIPEENIKFDVYSFFRSFKRHPCLARSRKLPSNLFGMKQLHLHSAFSFSRVDGNTPRKNLRQVNHCDSVNLPLSPVDQELMVPTQCSCSLRAVISHSGQIWKIGLSWCFLWENLDIVKSAGSEFLLST